MPNANEIEWSDPLLQPFLRAADGASAEKELDRLIEEHAAPLLQTLLGRKFGVSLRPARASLPDATQEEAHDVYVHAIFLLCKEMPRLRTPDAPPVRYFLALVRRTAEYAYGEYLRRKHPQRRNLRDCLRELLRGRTLVRGFALWTTEEGETLAGFAAWQGQGKRRTRRYETLLLNPQLFAHAVLPHQDARRLSLADLIAAIFRWVGGPVEQDDLVRALFALRGLQEEAPRARSASSAEDGDEQIDPMETLPDWRPTPESALDRRELLRWFWEEMGRYPPMTVQHRRAVLLQRSTTYLEELRAERIARIREIAAGLEIAAEELAGMYYKELPEDAELARRFTFKDRQEVINRRMAAYRTLKQRYHEAFLDQFSDTL